MSKREEPLILSIETATRAGSIALSLGPRLISARTGDPARSHSTDLLELIHEALEEAALRIEDVALFAVTLGPGSFTGLRIGVATAKGLASTLERRVVGVPTLHAVALSAGACERVVTLLPAGRGELFAQSFRVEKPLEVIALDEAAHIAPSTLFEKLRSLRNICWAGEGARGARERILELAAEEGIPFIEEGIGKKRDFNEGWWLAAPAVFLADYVGQLAFRSFSRGETIGPDELQAIYVRPSDAELKGICRT